MLNYTHILAAHGFTQPVHINCSIQEQNWERHVGLRVERGAHLLKFMYCSAWFPKPRAGTLSHRRLHHCLREREEPGQNCSTVWFHCRSQLCRHARHKPKTRPVGFQCLQTQNTPRANCGNCVTIYVRLFTHQIFSEDKKKYYNFSSHESKISLCILPSWDQTASPRCAQQPAQHSSLAASLISLASPK